MTFQTLQRIHKALSRELDAAEVGKDATYKALCEVDPDGAMIKGSELTNYNAASKFYNETKAAMDDFLSHDWH